MSSIEQITQHQLPLSGRYQCETCFEPVPADMSAKSEERYNHVLCFKHQLQFKKYQVQQRLAKAEQKIQQAALHGSVGS